MPSFGCARSCRAQVQQKLQASCSVAHDYIPVLDGEFAPNALVSGTGNRCLSGLLHLAVLSSTQVTGCGAVVVDIATV
jgi:hypothetical protein